MPESDFDRDVAKRTAAIHESWMKLVERVRHGYTAKGRGLLLIDLAKPLEPGLTPYFTLAELPTALGVSEDEVVVSVGSRTSTYNPENTIVVVFVAADRSTAQCVEVFAPREFRKLTIVSDLPDPTTAKSFDGLLDILEDIDSRDRIHDTAPAARHVWRIMEAQWSVDADGFWGYFYYNINETAELIAAIEAVGSPVIEQAFAAAFVAFPSGRPPDDEDERHKQMEALGIDGFKQADSDLYDAEDRFEKILWKYWKRNRK